MPLGVAILFSVGALIGIEFLKRMTFTPSVKEYLQFKKVSAFPLLIASSMLGVSLWLTYNGTHEAVFTLTEKPTLLNVDSLTGYEKERISQINSDIANAKRITWQGKLTEKGQNLIAKLTNERSKIQDKLDTKETALNGQNDTTSNDHTNKTLERSTHFRFLTLALDLLLFVLLAWLEYYDFRSLTEFAKLVPVAADNPHALRNTTAQDDTHAMRNNAMRADNALRDEIPFSDNRGRAVVRGFRRDDNALRTPSVNVKGGEVLTVKKACSHCGGSYERRTTFQKYCSEACRIRAYEQRTGKKFRKAKSQTV